MPPAGPLQPEPDAWIDLWPEGAAGMPAPPPAEEVRERSNDPTYNDRAMFHVRRPRLAVFPARPDRGAQQGVRPSELLRAADVTVTGTGGLAG